MPHNPYEKVSIYGKNQKVQTVPADNTRETDARALLSCANKLFEAKELLGNNVKSKKYLKIYGDAIRKNQRLWTLFQVAVTDPDNPLPDSLKVNILNLGRYVDKTSFSAVSKYAPDQIDSLVNINRIIAAGLSKQPPKEQGAAAPQSAGRDALTSLMTSA